MTATPARHLLYACCFLLVTFSSVAAQAQRLNKKLTPHLYLGAPKSQLIDLATSQARLVYETNQQDVIGRQKKYKGVNLKKKEARERFINDMVADIKSKLEASNNWYDMQLRLGDKYLVTIESLLGSGVKLIGFDDLLRIPESDVSLFFRNEKVASITVTKYVTTVLNPKKVLPLKDDVTEQLGRILYSEYDEDYTTTTQYSKTSWNSDHDIYERRIDRYNALSLYESFPGDVFKKVSLDVAVYYEPYGMESNNRYYYRGQALTILTYTVTIEE